MPAGLLDRLPVIGFGWRDVLRMAAWPMIGLVMLVVVVVAVPAGRCG